MCDINKVYGNYHKRNGWKLWEGFELEGRFKGVYTLFVGDTPESEVLEHFGAYPHIYFNPVFLWNFGFEIVEAILKTKTLVTVSLTLEMLSSVPKRLRRYPNFHVMAVIPVDSELNNYLIDTDTIRIQISSDISSNMDSYQCTFKQLTAAKTEEYSIDKQVL